MQHEAQRTDPEEDLRERESRVREERAKRDKAHETADRRRVLEFNELLLELEDKYGRRGRDFEIVDAGAFGFVGLKRGEAVLWKSYRAKILRDKYIPTPEEVLGFVRPQVVHPTTARFDEIVGEMQALLDVCANALVELHGVKGRDDAGK